MKKYLFITALITGLMLFAGCGLPSAENDSCITVAEAKN